MKSTNYPELGVKFLFNIRRKEKEKKRGGVQRTYTELRIKDRK